MSMFRAIFWRLFFLVLLFAISFCFFLLYKNLKSVDKNNVVVAFGNYALFKSDLEGMNQNERDHCINDWLITHYLEDEFNRQADSDVKIEIDKKVASYRSKLCAHMQLASLTAKKIDLEVSDQEINQFYKKTQKSFLLQDCLFKGIYIVIPKSLKENIAIKHLLDQPIKNKEALKKNCFVAKKYIIDDNVWLLWDAELENTPYANQDLKNNFCEKRLYIFYDKTYAYYLWITELKKSGEVAPLSMIKDKVKKSLMFNKKLEIEKQIRKEMLVLLKKDKNFKSYENEE
jgi:hypothetical protein